MPLLTSFPAWLMVTAFASTGLIVALVAPAPRPPEAPQQAVEAWQLPSVSKAEPARAVEILNTSNLWGKLPEAAPSGPLIDPPWRILGVARKGAERFVLIQVTGQPARTVSVNDTLPGGSTIVKIEDDALCLSINGTKRRLPIARPAALIL